MALCLVQQSHPYVTYRVAPCFVFLHGLHLVHQTPENKKLMLIDLVGQVQLYDYLTGLQSPDVWLTWF